MTVASTLNRVTYAGPGGGPFSYPFRILQAADLIVTKRASGASVETTLTLTTDYTIVGVGIGTGGSITLVKPLVTGDTLVLRRVPALVQPRSIRNQGPSLPDVHEDAWDQLTMADQANAETLGRTLSLPITTAGVNPTLLPPVAGQVIGWDATGTAIKHYDPNPKGDTGATGARGPAGLGGPIPIVASPTERDILYPAPAVDNAARVKSLGVDQRFGAPTVGANQWLSTGLTRDAGPVITANSKGAVGDGGTDCTPFLQAASVAAVASGGRVEIDPDVPPFMPLQGPTFLLATDCTLNAHFQPNSGALIRPAAGKTLLINGTLADVRHAWIDQQLGGKVLCTNSPIGSVRTSWFKEIQVTVPAPTLAPTVTAQQDAYGSAGMIAGHTYAYGYTYIGYDGGETLMSPVTTIAAVTGFEVAIVQFFGGLSCRAIAVAVYWRDVTAGGSFIRTVYAPNGKYTPGISYANQWGFGDQTDAAGLYGVIAPNDPDGAIVANYPGAATAHDADGTALSTPTTAPVVGLQQALPALTTFYVAYSYTCQDGTETALSPVSASATTPANGGCLRLLIGQLPPAGATGLNVYVGTVSNALKKQLTNQPLHYLFIQVNSYNAGGASNAPGACQSTISPLQQAWDCVHDSGGGRSVIVDALQQTYVPLIFGQPDGNATGIHVRGEGGSSISSGNQQKAKVSYVGPAQSNLVFIVSASTGSTFEHLDFDDHNARISRGVGYCDSNGGQSFTNVWRGVGLRVTGSGSTTLQVNNHSAANAHTASEQKFYDCTFYADAWCIDVRGNQTGNFRFESCYTFSQGRSATISDMDSGDFKIMCTDTVVVHNHFGTAHGGHTYYIGSETGYHAGSGSCRFLASSIDTEMDNGGPMYLYISTSDLDYSMVTMTQHAALNNLGRSAYDVYCGSGANITLVSPTIGNVVYLDHASATLVTLGKNVTPSKFKRSSRFGGGISAGFPAYYPPLTLYGAGGIAFGSDTGVITELRKLSGTKAAVTPGAALANGATQLVTTVTVTGVTIADSTVESVRHAGPLGTYFFGVVTADNTVTVYQSNYTGGAVSVLSGTLTVIATKQIQ